MCLGHRTTSRGFEDGAVHGPTLVECRVGELMLGIVVCCHNGGRRPNWATSEICRNPIHAERRSRRRRIGADREGATARAHGIPAVIPADRQQTPHTRAEAAQPEHRPPQAMTVWTSPQCGCLVRLPVRGESLRGVPLPASGKGLRGGCGFRNAAQSRESRALDPSRLAPQR